MSVFGAFLVGGSSSLAWAEEPWLPSPETKTSTGTYPTDGPPSTVGPEQTLVRGPQVILRAQGGIATGALPGSGPVLGLSGALRVDPIRYAIHGRIRLARDMALPDSNTRVVSVDLWSVGARVCPELRIPPGWFLSGCIGAEGGRFRTEEADLSTSDLWAAALISAELGVELLGPVGVWVGSDLGLTFVDAEYAPEGLALISTGPVFLTAELGIELHLD